MKQKLLLSLLLSFSFYLLSSQIPQGFNYQAIARNETGNPIVNATLPVTITIKSDSVGGTIYWEELHPSVTTNNFGLLTLAIGKGSRQIASTVPAFNDINWNQAPLFIKTQIFYQSQLLDMGTARLLSVPYAMVAGDLDGSVEKLEIAGKTTDMEEALFEVKNKDGETVFAVYNQGVRIYVGDGLDEKGIKGGFAVGGFDMTKGSQDLLVVNSDSIRAYIDTNPGKAKKGGFAVGGFDMTKDINEEYLRVTPDSTRIYLNETETKGKKGGFAVGGYDLTKTANEEYLRVTRDSTRVYLNNETKGKKGGFAVGGFDMTKGVENEYLRVTTDSVKVSKSLLIPRLTTEERDNLPFIPGEALIIFNMTEGCMQIFKNDVWSNIWCFNCAPDFIIQPVDKTICSGENAVFFVSATGTSLSYKWQQSVNGGSTWSDITNGGSNPAISGANGYTLTLSNVPVSYHSFKYRCVVAGSCLPDVTSNDVTLNVGSTPPVITSQPTDQQLSTGCSASFSIISPGYGVTYKWQQSADGGSTWTNITDGGTSPVFAGSTTSTLSLSNVSLAYNNYKFLCIVSNSCGTDAFSNAATLTMNSSPAITVQPVNKLVYVNQNITFNITTSGSGFNYQWQVSTNGGGTWTNVTNGGTDPTYSGANTIALVITKVPLSFNNYKYRCVVSHFCRLNEVSEVATLSVPTTGTITDIDGNTYNTVGIGSQLWIKENLKTTKYNDGTSIPLVTTGAIWAALSTPAYCWYNNDAATNKATYGALYNWFAVNTGKLCPVGWHIPSNAEWTSLINYILNNGYSYGGDINYYAKSMATTSGWTIFTDYTGVPGNDQASNNSTGFSATPGGYRYYFDGSYALKGNDTYWWTSNAYDATTAYYRHMGYSNGNVPWFTNNKLYGHSVRCVKD